MTEKIIGHQHEREFLERVCRGRMHGHAFLFTGPESVGKMTIALRFAQALTQGEEEIVWCYGTQTQDMIMVRPEIVEEKKRRRIKQISVNEVRDVRRKMMLAHDGHAKVLIVDDAHYLTHAAQNALLKIIEEPPQNTFIIFVTSDKERLLATVRSRMTAVAFGLVSDDVLAEVCESDTISMAQGRPGYAYAMKNNAQFIEEHKEYITLLKNLKNTSLHERIALAQELSNDDVRAQKLLKAWLWHVRRILLETKKIQIIGIVERIAQTLRAYHNPSTNKKLLLEDLLIHL